MQILLDTNVLSETTRPSPDPNVSAFLARGIPAYVTDPARAGMARLY